MILTGFLLAVFLVLMWFFVNADRRLVYYDQRGVFAGIGESTSEKVGAFSIKNLANPEEVEVVPESDYVVGSTDLTRYSVTYLPPATSLAFAVGKFERFEDITESTDKYLLMDVNETIKKYRVVFDSDVKKRTFFMVESFLNNMASRSVIIEPGMPFDRARKLFIRGDVVVVLPLLSESRAEIRDETEVLFIQNVIIRRKFGVNAVKNNLITSWFSL